MSTFIGKDSFVWWVGVVEKNTGDELLLGRCQVRIFGWHTDNKQLIPTSDLPWATPLYPLNSASKFDVPSVGDYVFGFFSDGMSGQAPIMMGVFPAIPQKQSDQSISSSGDEALQATQDAEAAQLAAQEGSAFATPAPIAETGDEALQATNEAQLAAQEGSAFAVPKPPKAAVSMLFNRIGYPTTPTNAYSANGTIVAITNSQLTHSCDFRFLVDFPSLDIGVILNPIKLIEESIKNAQNKAAAIVRTLLAQVIDKFRLVLKGITATLNFDPTGQIAKAIAKVREVIRTINYYSKKLAEVVGQVALVLALIKEIKQVIEWIKSLPEQVLALLKNCLTNFQNAITSAVSQISLLPGQISDGVEGAFRDLENSTSETISQAQQAEQTANVPNTLITLVSSPETSNANILFDFITSQYPNANVIITGTNSASFNIANSSTP